MRALEFVARSDVELVEVGRTEVGQRMSLEPGPKEFDGVKSGEYGGRNAIWRAPSVESRYSRTSLLRWAFRPSQMISSGRFK